MADDDLLSIGDLAEASGIAPDTIRVWERRYGRPEALRLASGHRRYTSEHLRWIRAVAEAIAAGHRPGVAVRASDEELSAMVGGVSAEKATAQEQAILEVIRAYDAGELDRIFDETRKRLGTPRFLDRFLDPLLVLVGRAWAEGQLDIRHEHFLSRFCEAYLQRFPGRARHREDSPVMIFATLPGEEHSLGMLMAAVIVSDLGVRPIVLGANTPCAEIAGSAREAGAVAVGVSVSLSSGGVQTDRALAALVDLLPAGVALVAGGRGARGPRRGPRGITYASELSGFAEWARLRVGEQA